MWNKEIRPPPQGHLLLILLFLQPIGWVEGVELVE